MNDAGILTALRSIGRAKVRTWLWLGIYVVAGILLLEILLGLVYANREAIRGWLLWYLFPEPWHDAVRDLIDRMFAERMRSIIINAGLGLTLVAVGIGLFPIKEKVSACFEQDLDLDLPTGNELPLWRQGVEELKLLFFYLAMQALSIYLGLQQLLPLAVVASIIGYWYLVITMAIDHAAPAFQRRGHRYACILPTLVWRLPLGTHLFGALFALPVVGLTWLLVGPLGLDPLPAAIAILILQMLAMGFATLVGCALGARLLQQPERLITVGVPARLGAWLLLLGILVWQGIFFSWLLKALHHKSQILKCHYALDWASLKPQIRAGEDGTVLVRIEPQVIVTNPTPFDLAFEDLDILVEHEERLLTSTHIEPFTVPAGGDTALHLDLETQVTASAVAQAIKDRGRFGYFILIRPPLSGEIKVPLKK